MQNKKTIYIIIILVLALALGAVWLFFGRGGEENPLEVSKDGKVVAVRVERPNFIIETKDMSEVEVLALPTGTEVTSDEAVSLGRPTYVSENNGLQLWTLAIPTEPMLFTHIFVRGFDRRDVAVEEFQMKEVGATEIYNLLWGDSNSKEENISQSVDVKVGEEKNIAGLKIKLLGISEDSRCPLGVTCFWAGRATVQFELNNGREVASKTMYSDEEKILEFAGYKIDLVSVKPNPVTGDTLEQSDYSVVFIITL